MDENERKRDEGSARRWGQQRWRAALTDGKAPEVYEICKTHLQSSKNLGVKNNDILNIFRYWLELKIQTYLEIEIEALN